MHDQVKKSAWEKGNEWAKAGKKRNANPYHYHHPDHEHWDEGWRAGNDATEGEND